MKQYKVLLVFFLIVSISSVLVVRVMEEEKEEWTPTLADIALKKIMDDENLLNNIWQTSSNSTIPTDVLQKVPQPLFLKEKLYTSRLSLISSADAKLRSSKEPRIKSSRIAINPRDDTAIIHTIERSGLSSEARNMLSFMYISSGKMLTIAPTFSFNYFIIRPNGTEILYSSDQNLYIAKINTRKITSSIHLAKNIISADINTQYTMYQYVDDQKLNIQSRDSRLSQDFQLPYKDTFWALHPLENKIFTIDNKNKQFRIYNIEEESIKEKIDKSLQNLLKIKFGNREEIKHIQFAYKYNIPSDKSIYLIIITNKRTLSINLTEELSYYMIAPTYEYVTMMGNYIAYKLLTKEKTTAWILFNVITKNNFYIKTDSKIDYIGMTSDKKYIILEPFWQYCETWELSEKKPSSDIPIIKKISIEKSGLSTSSQVSQKQPKPTIIQQIKQWIRQRWSPIRRYWKPITGAATLGAVGAAAAWYKYRKR